jgi:hypothetical protein
MSRQAAGAGSQEPILTAIDRAVHLLAVVNSFDRPEMAPRRRCDFSTSEI